MKTLILIVVLVVLGGTFYLVRIRNNTTVKSYSKSTKTSLAIAKNSISVARPSQASNTNYGFPTPPLSCSTNSSNIPLSIDYIITAMPCSATGGQQSLSCNGTILQGASNVSIDCSLANNSNKNRVVCSGTTNVASGPTNLALNYNCYPTNSLSHTIIYSCTGNIAGYSSGGISLPLNVSCSS